MKHYLLTLALLVVFASPGLADTRTGTANPTSLHSWSFVNVGPGETKITLSWTRSPAKLFMILVCGTADPQTFGVAGAGLDRYAELVVGPTASTTCLVGVSSFSQASAYRIHFNQTTSEVSAGRGRAPLDANTAQLNVMQRFAELEADRIRQRRLLETTR